MIGASTITVVGMTISNGSTYKVLRPARIKNGTATPSLSVEVEKAGFVYYFLPALVLGERVRPEQCDALLRVGGSDGYASRLYLEAKVVGPNQLNWNSEAFILQHQWYAFSWQARDSSTGLRLLTAHLRAFR